MKPLNHHSSDVMNAYRLLERSLKACSIRIRDFEPNVSDGDGVAYAKILRILLLQSCRDVALMMLERNGLSANSSDRRIVLSAFDLLRENRMAPSISAEQFLGKNFVEHKIIIIHKIAEYVNNTKRKTNNPNDRRRNKPDDHYSSKVSSRRNSPDDHNSSKSYLDSNYIYESNNDVDLDDEIWVSKYVNHLDEISPLAISQLEMSNNNKNTNDNNRSSLRSSNVDTNITHNNESEGTMYLVSNAELQRLIQTEVNKEIVFYNEKNSLLIEQLKRSFDTKLSILEKKLHSLES